LASKFIIILSFFVISAKIFGGFKYKYTEIC
jgi:hypothetical protein